MSQFKSLNHTLTWGFFRTQFKGTGLELVRTLLKCELQNRGFDRADLQRMIDNSDDSALKWTEDELEVSNESA